MTPVPVPLIDPETKIVIRWCRLIIKMSGVPMEVASWTDVAPDAEQPARFRGRKR